MIVGASSVLASMPGSGADGGGFAGFEADFVSICRISELAFRRDEPVLRSSSEIASTEGW
jgi:hypothetical protein